jgi:hypothetical protein
MKNLPLIPGVAFAQGFSSGGCNSAKATCRGESLTLYSPATIMGTFATPQKINMSYGANGIALFTGSVTGGDIAFGDSAANLRANFQHGLIIFSVPTTNKLQFAYTADTGASPVTINKATGLARVASGTNVTTVTNSLVDAASIVICSLRTTGAGIANVVCAPGSGSFTATTVNGTGAVTNTTANADFTFFVIDTP